jgi:hypothetical protein
MGKCLSGQLSFFANVLLSKCHLGKCLSGQMSFWANVLLGKCLLGKCRFGQMSIWANVFWANVFLGKCLSGQMSFWANVVWANVPLGKRRMGKWLWANVSGQTSYEQMSFLKHTIGLWLYEFSSPKTMSEKESKFSFSSACMPCRNGVMMF